MGVRGSGARYSVSAGPQDRQDIHRPKCASTRRTERLASRQYIRHWWTIGKAPHGPQKGLGVGAPARGAGNAAPTRSPSHGAARVGSSQSSKLGEDYIKEVV